MQWVVCAWCEVVVCGVLWGEWWCRGGSVHGKGGAIWRQWKFDPVRVKLGPSKKQVKEKKKKRKEKRLKVGLMVPSDGMGGRGGDLGRKKERVG